MSDESCHIPVLLHEVVQYMRAEAGGSFLDCTAGGGGHTEALLTASDANTVLALDRDRRAVERLRRRFSKFGQRIRIEQADFKKLPEIVAGERFDGILADLGLSSDQLAEGRGFSFTDPGPLDMRMDEEQPLTADQLVNTIPVRDLAALFQRGGVGRESRRLAEKITAARPIRSAAALAELIDQARPWHRGNKGTHPATVCFQALRMEVNQEQQQLQALLDFAPQAAAPQARLAIISFHSLEDRRVTSELRRWEQGGSRPALWPDQPGKALVRGRLLTRKQLNAAPAEISVNPRARSAVLRVFEFN